MDRSEEITLLLVEDDASAYALLPEWHVARIDARPVRWVRAGSLADALDMLVGLRFDALLVDMSHSDVHGITGVERIRQAAPDTPLVALTGQPDAELEAAVLGLGAEDVLDKASLSAPLLARVVGYALERWQYQRHLRQLRDGFLAHVSHELRTPLTVAYGHLEMLLDGDAGPVDDLQRYLLGQAYRNLDELRRMIADLVQSAEVEAGAVDLHPRSVDVGRILADGVAECSVAAEKARVLLTCRVPPGIPEVLTDRDRAAEIVARLVSNGIKHSLAEGEVSVIAGLDPARPGQVVISVRDRGEGLGESERHRVFSQAYQKSDTLTPSTSRNGLGLGLHISNELVHLLGGEIWVESVPGGGATFRFTLPAVPVPGRPGESAACGGEQLGEVGFASAYGLGGPEVDPGAGEALHADLVAVEDRGFQG